MIVEDSSSINHGKVECVNPVSVPEETLKKSEIPEPTRAESAKAEAQISTTTDDKAITSAENDPAVVDLITAFKADLQVRIANEIL